MKAVAVSKIVTPNSVLNFIQGTFPLTVFSSCAQLLLHHDGQLLLFINASEKPLVINL